MKILLEKQWDLYRNGAKTCGTGPSASNRTDRKMAKQREAFRFVEELNILESGKYQQEDTVAKAFEECEIDPTCAVLNQNLSPKSK